MRKVIYLWFLVVSPCWAGPYVEMGLDYDPNPDSLEYYNNDNELIKTVHASHYQGVASTGWEWDVNNLLSVEDSLTVRLKVFEHFSDVMHSGQKDVVSKNEIRGVSVKYRFW